MEMYIIVCVATLVASFIALFSGFGLSTILVPVLVNFFPAPYAIGIAAIVHMLNNVFKVSMFGKYANKKIILTFAVPGTIATIAGALLLGFFARMQPVAIYELWWGKFCTITVVNLTVGIMMILFSIFELIPRFEQMEFDKKWMPFGGALSGFFGGLTGQQGALRSAFLSKAGLSKEAFIGTGVVTAFMIDLVRISVYARAIPKYQNIAGVLILVATLTAFLGSFIGARLFKKITIRKVQLLVGVLLIIRGFLLALGIA